MIQFFRRVVRPENTEKILFILAKTYRIVAVLRLIKYQFYGSEKLSFLRQQNDVATFRKQEKKYRECFGRFLIGRIRLQVRVTYYGNDIKTS